MLKFERLLHLWNGLWEKQRLYLAIAVIILTSLLAWVCGVRFDGVLDAHIGSPSLVLVSYESMVDWVVLSLCFFGVARLLGKKESFELYLSKTGIARFPFLFIAILSSRLILPLEDIQMTGEKVTIDISSLISPYFLVISLMILVFVVWALALFYYGFKDTSKLEGGKAVGGFFIALIIAEIVSKILISLAG